jgi:hypothetical protein
MAALRSVGMPPSSRVALLQTCVLQTRDILSV